MATDVARPDVGIKGRKRATSTSAGLKLVSGMAFAGRPTASRLSRSFSNAAGPSSMSFSMTCHIGGLSSGFSLKTGFGTPGALAFSDSVGFAWPSSLVFGHRLM
ncbi:hypothetical protein HYQ46_004169 [Verticillium longisporum]|nr:hypothetical protein HYQ46_004169 [Verticillium longisporum]